ncbi:MAG: hypothetical protein WCK84_11640 [Bacteroidota bacterium]
MKIKICLTILLIWFSAMYASAWVYPEHREIMIAAIKKLDPNRRAILDQLWASARKGYEIRLCESVIEPNQGVKPQCLDYAAWTGIAADHSVSAQDMTNIVLKSTWILKVADITAQLKVGLDKSQKRSSRISEVRDSDIKLLRADPEYVSRAGKNNGHFLLPLPGVNTKPEVYFSSCYKDGAEMNTVGSYTWFHISALSKAARLNSKDLTPEQQSALALSALADEAFAAHFLEDSFTSGHVMGIWGDAAKRKGTHDYYNEEGLDVTTWQGKQMVLMGDATMRREDVEWTSEAVLKSLEQMLDAVSGAIRFDPAFLQEDLSPATPDTFNVSKAMVMPLRPVDDKVRILCDTVLMEFPIPGLTAGMGQFPRFRAEMGPFAGVSGAANLNYLDGGFFDYQKGYGFTAGVELGLRVGLGMEGVLNESGDGLVFLDFGVRIDLSSTQAYDGSNNNPDLSGYGAMLSAIPSRSALSVRFRLPFFLIPGDLIILAPLLALTSPNSMQKVVTASANGGLIPWQTGLPTPIGRFQFILGREVAISFYGSGRRPDTYTVLPPNDEVSGYYTLNTTRFEFPIVEYRPFRTYSSRQTGSLLFQLLAGFDVPGKRSQAVKEHPDIGLPATRTIWYAGIRLVFDYRYYFSGTKR